MSLARFRFSLHSLVVWTKRFVRENPGVLFIVGFQALLVACAVMLTVGMSVLAESVAVVAYFLLVAGVVVQLVCFVRGSRGNGIN